MSGEELSQRPDLNPCELVNGKVVLLNPAEIVQGMITADLGSELAKWNDSHQQGEVLMGGVGLYIRYSPDTVRATDLLYISNDRYARQGASEFLDVAPELVIEIIAPVDLWTDVIAKLDDYFFVGVDRVWVVDPKLHRVFAYRSMTEAQQFKDGDVLVDEELLPGFRLPITDLFRGELDSARSASNSTRPPLDDLGNPP